MKSILILCLLFLLAGCSGKDRDVLMIAEQGSFAVGGNIGFFLGPLMVAFFLSAFGMHGTGKAKTRVFAASAVYCGNTAVASKQNNCPLRVFTGHKC